MSATLSTTRRIMCEHRSLYVPPVIRLEGKWLLAAGFTPGQPVEVIQVRPGELIVRAAQPPFADPTLDWD